MFSLYFTYLEVKEEAEQKEFCPVSAPTCSLVLVRRHCPKSPSLLFGRPAISAPCSPPLPASVNSLP